MSVMSTEAPTVILPEPSIGPPAAERRSAVRCAGSFLFNTVVVVYFLFCAVFLGLRYLVLPNIDHYKPDIEQLASRALGNRISIGEIDASWRGLNPQLLLRDVAIYGDDGIRALELPEVDAGVSWLSVPAMNLRLDWLHINRPDLQVRRHKDGRLSVAGIVIGTDKRGDGEGMDWVLSQHEIVIRGGKLRWIDEQRNAPELLLTDVDLRLASRWAYHRFALRATPPPEYAAPLDLRAYFEHELFGKKISDVTGWKGEVYADMEHADLAVWNAFVDYPVALSKGKGTLRAWLDFEQANVTDFSADVSLTDVGLRLGNDLPKLELTQLDGRISAKESGAGAGVFSFGDQGHQVTLTDFSLRTQSGLLLAPTTLGERFVAATEQVPALTEVTASSLDLATLTELAGHLPLPQTIRQALVSAAPRGSVKDFLVRWQDHAGDSGMKAYRIKGAFDNLSLRAREAIPAQLASAKQPARGAVSGWPGVENLSGRINATEQGGSVTLASTGAVLQLPMLLRDPALALDALNLSAQWRFTNANQVRIQIDDITMRQSGPQGKVAGSMSGTLQMPLRRAEKESPGVANLKGRFTEIDLRQVSRYWPRQLSDKLHAWLAGGLREGVGRDVTFALKGDLADFPFRTTKQTDKPKGIFTVAGRIDGGTLDYAPGDVGSDGVSPLWPSIEQINGLLTIDRTRLDIRADSGVTRKLKLSDVQASIPDLLAGDETKLIIKGNAAGALQEMVGFVNNSPITNWIGRFVDEAKASGPAKLTLALQLPLDRLKESKVDGTLQLANNDLTLMPILPPLLQTSGKLAFTEKGFDLVGVNAGLLGGQSTISGGSKDDGPILVEVKGSVTADGARATYTDPAMQRLLERVSGNASYIASIAVREGRSEIVVESSLEGVGLDFPAPLRKAIGTGMSLNLRLTGQPSNDALIKRDEIRLALGKTMEARYQREKHLSENGGQDGDWKVVAGGIGVNEPAPQPDNGLIANVSVNSLSVDHWRDAVASITGSPGASSAREKPSSSADSGTSVGLAQYIDPEVVAARADTLFIMGKKLENVVVGASFRNNAWQANIDSRQASGHVTWNSGTGPGRLIARLSSLIIPESTATDVGDLLEGKSEDTQIPALDIIADDFQLFGKRFGRLELDAVNVRGNRRREWRIGKLSIENPDATLKASGSWFAGEEGSTSNLAYHLDIADAGQLLERFGFANVLAGGKGSLDGDLSWKGLPFSLDIPSLAGNMKLDVRAGQFLKVDPGAAKLLGVLSLQSLPRRLSLDFRDVFSEGYAFDSVVGTAAIEKGKLTTDNFKMRSINATVLMDGTADIAGETQNLHVAVIPKINAGAASILYGLAINPVIGVGTFLAQMFLSDPLSRAFTFEYQITGPWKEPVVTKLDRATGKPAHEIRDRDPITNQAG